MNKNKNGKRILCGLGILVLGLIIYSCVSGDYEIITYFFMGIGALIILFSLGCVVFLGIKTIFSNLKGYIKLHNKEKNIHRKKVEKKKYLPLYSINTRTIGPVYVFWIFIIGLIFSYIWELISPAFQINNDDFGVYFIFDIIMLSLVGGPLLYYVKLRPVKMLYLIKGSDKILNYEDNIDSSPELFTIYSRLGIDGSFASKKCESIELNNNIKIWSCFSKYYSPNDSEGGSIDYQFIIASKSYDNTNKFDIEINNKPSTYLNKDNLYIPKYSNLPPFLIAGEDAEDICQKIEEVCSDFFSKIRSRYVLIIREGSIGLGLDSARFGRVNRIFQKDKTAELTKEAIEEISNFMLKIKNIIDRN